MNSIHVKWPENLIGAPEQPVVGGESLEGVMCEILTTDRESSGFGDVFDDREFTPHTVNTGRSRVEQEVIVDLAREELLTYADTGRSKERVDRANDTREIREGKADTSGIAVADIV